MKDIIAKFNNPQDVNLHTYLNAYGIDDVNEFISPKGKYLDNEADYLGMEEGVRLIESLSPNDKIGIVVDSDMDGYMSATIAYLFLRHIGFENIEPIFHKGKQHGLSDLMWDMIPARYNLVWLPDSGTNDAMWCETLSVDNYSKVLITDHHKSTKPNPYAIIINNQLSPNVKNKSLCGAGVTYKFIQYYCKKHNLDFHLGVLDLVAVANIADVMAMSSYENRTFNYYGLRRINNYFLSFLCDTYIKDKPLTPHNISWNISPKINALCRSDKQDLKKRVFNAFVGLDDDYEGIIDELKKCHNEQTNETNRLYKQIITQPKAEYGGVIMHTTENTPYTGLIANKLLDHYKSPVMLVHKKENDEWLGSCRSPIPFQSILNNSGVMSVCNGHEQAFGIGWYNESTNDLITYLSTLSLDFTPQTEVTCRADNIMQIPKDMYEIGYYYEHLWGTGLPTPTVNISMQIKGVDIKELGANKRTLKFRMGFTDFILFNASKEMKEKLYVGKDHWIMIDIIGEPTLNEFRGKVEPQIIIKDIEVI